MCSNNFALGLKSPFAFVIVSQSKPGLRYTIANAKRRHDTVHGRLTRMEKDISKLEEKEGVTSFGLMKIKHLKELAKKHDCEFEQRHIEVLNFIEAEDKAALNSEEAILDEHLNHVLEIIERLEALEERETSSSRCQKCSPPAQNSFVASNKHVCMHCYSYLEVSSRDCLIASDERVYLQ